MNREKKAEREKRIFEKAMEARKEELKERAYLTENELTPEEVDGMFQRFCKTMQERGVMDENGALTENSQSMDRTVPFEKGKRVREEEKHKKRRAYKSMAKAAGIVLVAGACIFGLSMTSEANRLRVMRQVESIRNAGSGTKINNGEDRDVQAEDEETAKNEISEKLKISVPEFYYMPGDMRFLTYSIFESTGYAKITYQFLNGFIYLEMANSEMDLSYSNVSEENSDNIDIEILDGQLNVSILDLSQNDIEQYKAQWQYKNTYYEIVGNIQKDELMQILKKMQYKL